MAGGQEGTGVAVFDLDGGLTAYPVTSVLREVAGVRNLTKTIPSSRRLGLNGLRADGRLEFGARRLLRLLAGQKASECETVARRFADGTIRRARGEVFERLERHRRHGDELVLVSAWPDVCVRLLADRLGVDATLCTRAEVDASGRLTGDPAGPVLCGDEKDRQLKAFLGGGRDLWMYDASGLPDRDEADLAPPPPPPPPPPAPTLPQTGEALPYLEIFRDAERTGRVLHRDDIYGSGPPVDDVSEEILAFVAGNTGQSILDVGCGIGPYVDRLAELGRDCIGIEIDKATAEAAQELGRDVRHMSAYDLDFPDDSFDSVILVETLEHLTDFEAALAEASRVARQSIVVTVPDISAVSLLGKRLLVPWHLLEATHVNFFTPMTLRALLLKYTASCDATRLGPFFNVDGFDVFMHAAVAARLADPKAR